MATKKKEVKKEITITLTKSVIGSNKSQLATVKSLGLGKMGSSRKHAATPQILGMVNKIRHLVSVDEG